MSYGKDVSMIHEYDAKPYPSLQHKGFQKD